MRKLIKLERIRANRESIQKKWNKKWLTRGIFTCVVAIALIGSCRYISGIVKVSSNVNGFLGKYVADSSEIYFT